ncbi:MAG: PKD repeat protein [Halioglobus sp.]|jgi:PKD repeat protein
MCKGFLLSMLFILSVFQVGLSQEHDSHQIYKHVQSLKGYFDNEARSLFSANRNMAIPFDADLYIRKADYLILEESYVDEIKNERPKTLILDLPIDGQIYKVQLYKKEVTTQSYQVRTASGATTQKSKSVFYRGIMKDVKESFVSLSILNNSIHMTISNSSDNYEINKIDNNLYAAYKVSDSKHSQETGCSFDEFHQNENVKIKEDQGERSTGDCIEVYIECDFDSFLKNGSNVQNTEDWALAIMNEVEILYENEGVPLVVSDILVYDVTDPYIGGSSAGEMLGIMGGVVGDYDGRLAHVFSTRPVGGGVAFLNVLCATNNGSWGPFAVSGSMNTNIVPFPVYSWNVGVVAHELGHNIGSRHTHDCVWNGNNTQIDDCGPEASYVTDCYDSANPILPTSGTIMSYCHLIGGIGINLNNGFGPQPGALLLDRYLSAGCVTGDDCSGFGSGPPPVADFTFTQLNFCAPAEVQFIDLSTEAPTQYEWILPGATPNFSTEQNPFVTYTEPGFFDVTLTVTNASGSDDLTFTQLIEVFETPVPDFDFDLIGDSISFTNQTNLLVDSYFWDFGDGNASTLENPLHGYQTEGTYTVTLTVGNICGAFSIEKYVDVFLPPTADFAVGTTFGCAPLTVNFSSNSSNNTEEFLWTFEGGTPETSTQENPTVIYDEAGIYDVILKVTNEIGEDSITETSLITVEEAPTVDFNTSVDSLVVDFENISTGYDTLLWEFGDGNSSTLVAPTHTYETEDTYEVALTVINSCDTITMVQSINLITLPSAGYSVDVTEGCLPVTVAYSNTSSSNTSALIWSFPGGIPSTSTEENPLVVYETVGNYDVSLKVSNEVGEDSLLSIGLISILDVPTVDFDYIVEKFVVDFTEQSSNYDNLSWDYGDGNTSDEDNPIHTYAEEGAYEVVLNATNICGTIEESQTVSISILPVANYSVDITEGCIPFTIEYSNNSSPNVTAWQWTFPGGAPSTSTDENPFVSYTEEGVYDVTLIVSSIAGNDTLNKIDYIFTQDVPIANFEFSSLSEFEYAFSNTSTDADTYIWDFGDGTMSTEENSEHIYIKEGTYTVILSATNVCGTITYEEIITIIGTSTIDGLDVFGGVSISPNPNNGNFLLSMSVAVAGGVRMEIYNIYGQKLQTSNFLIGSGYNNLSIQLENSAPGAYLMLLIKGDQSSVVKFLIH